MKDVDKFKNLFCYGGELARVGVACTARGTLDVCGASGVLRAGGAWGGVGVDELRPCGRKTPVLTRQLGLPPPPPRWTLGVRKLLIESVVE